MRAVVVITLTAALIVSLPAEAGHVTKWHWRRGPQREITVAIGDNVGPSWTGPLHDAVLDWNRSRRVGIRLSAGRAYAPGRRNGCYYPNTIQVCGAPLRSSWVAVTSYYPSSDGSHIAAIGIEINSRRGGWTYEEMRNILCHEIGHALGLHHRRSPSSCMTVHMGPSARPDSHDYATLEKIYRHCHDCRPRRRRKGSILPPLDIPSRGSTRTAQLAVAYSNVS